MKKTMIGVHNNREDIELYIKKHTYTNSDCLLWSNDRTKAGHGSMRIGGANFAVRRVVWWLKNGYLPKGERMSDTCGNPLCCNINHLRDRTDPADRRTTLFHPGKSFNMPHVKSKTVELVWEQLLMGDTTMKAAARRWGTSVKTLRKHLKRYTSGL